MNTVLNCGQNLSTHQDQFFSFLYCIESQVSPSVEEQIPGERSDIYMHTASAQTAGLHLESSMMITINHKTLTCSRSAICILETSKLLASSQNS